MSGKSIEQYIFGRNPVLEAIKSNIEIDRILINYNASGQAIKQIEIAARKSKILVKKIKQKKFVNLVKSKQNHQGVIAVVNSFKYMDFDHFLLNMDLKQGKLLILEHIEDPHNLGAIIRTAECAGFDCVIIPEKKAASINDTVIKTSAGAAFHLPVIRVDDLPGTIEQLKEAGIFIFGSSINAAKLYFEANFNLPAGIVIGNEGKGISRVMQKLCDEEIKIPQIGRINSLNASVSAAILIYEVVRQRETD